MKKPPGFTELVKELSRDPQLKRAVASARRKTRGKGAARVENATGIVLLFLGIASRFAKKKKARALDEAMDVISLLVQVSMALKENIFDRPEVKRFFSRGFRQIYAFAQGLVTTILPKTDLPKTTVLPKTKGARPTRALRSV
jgi:hypothetical protein